MFRKLVKKYKVKEVAILWIVLELMAALFIVGVGRSLTQPNEITAVYHNVTFIETRHQEVIS